MKINDILALEDVDSIIFGGEKIEFDDKVIARVSDSFEFLKLFSEDKVIYGINTGFGPMAQWRIDDRKLRDLQFNIIRSHASGAGEHLPYIYVKSAMLARIMTFVQGKSGVSKQTIQILADFINNEIYPLIPMHGSVGASGDLVQLAHIALAMIGEGKVYYKGELTETKAVLDKLGIKPLQLCLREGLAITNGTSVMTGIGLVNVILAKKLLEWELVASVLMNEIASSYDDFMSEVLNGLKHHEGQQAIASCMRDISNDSKMLRNRAKELYCHNEDKIFEHKVQPYYSLRCIPQILGPIYDEIINAQKVLVNELNSVDDNPIVDPESKMVIHGGNFHGDYISFEMDKLKIAVAKLTMLAERQLNYLFHDRINGILPPFVNLGELGLNYGLQAAQFTATSTTAESQTLSNPMYVHSIPNNNDNQDIVSMGTNSALICKHVIENAYQVMSIHMMALVQAVDCLAIKDKLSSKTRELYDIIRNIVPVFIEDTPKYEEIVKLEELLKNTRIYNI